METRAIPPFLSRGTLPTATNALFPPQGLNLDRGGPGWRDFQSPFSGHENLARRRRRELPASHRKRESPSAAKRPPSTTRKRAHPAITAR
jgi:hypothetical protein